MSATFGFDTSSFSVCVKRVVWPEFGWADWPDFFPVRKKILANLKESLFGAAWRYGFISSYPMLTDVAVLALKCPFSTFNHSKKYFLSKKSYWEEQPHAICS